MKTNQMGIKWSRDFSKPIRGLEFWCRVNLHQNFLYKIGFRLVTQAPMVKMMKGITLTQVCSTRQISSISLGLQLQLRPVVVGFKLLVHNVAQGCNSDDHSGRLNQNRKVLFVQ